MPSARPRTPKPTAADLRHILPAIRAAARQTADLLLDPVNARKHPEKNLEAIKAALSRFGQQKPIVLREDGRTVLAGNGTLEAARALGWTWLAATDRETVPRVDDPDPAGWRDHAARR